MNTIEIEAYAKINLGLDVLKRRPDGYHEVRMVMQTVDIRDVLTFTSLEGTGSQDLDSEDGILLTSQREGLPLDRRNLVYRAADLLRKEFGIREPVGIHLEKHIPMSAGMAGGSSDCAATLRGINQLYNLGLSLEELKKRGVTLGADVPYCLEGGTCLSEGIGEKLTRLTDAPDCVLVIAKPPVDVSTAYVYGHLVLDSQTEHPDMDGMLQAIQAESLPGICDTLGNVLESVTIPQHPQIGRLKELMLQKGALGGLMSGSGPTVFGIFTDPERARQAAEKIRSTGLEEVFVTAFHSLSQAQR